MLPAACSTILIAVPVGNATVAFVGIDNVIFPAVVDLKCLPESSSAIVSSDDNTTGGISL